MGLDAGITARLHSTASATLSQLATVNGTDIYTVSKNVRP
jgi:hypothetical protein